MQLKEMLPFLLVFSNDNILKIILQYHIQNIDIGPVKIQKFITSGIPRVAHFLSSPSP